MLTAHSYSNSDPLPPSPPSRLSPCPAPADNLACAALTSRSLMRSSVAKDTHCGPPLQRVLARACSHDPLGVPLPSPSVQPALGGERVAVLGGSSPLTRSARPPLLDNKCTCGMSAYLIYALFGASPAPASPSGPCGLDRGNIQPEPAHLEGLGLAARGTHLSAHWTPRTQGVSQPPPPPPGICLVSCCFMLLRARACLGALQLRTLFMSHIPAPAPPLADPFLSCVPLADRLSPRDARGPSIGPRRAGRCCCACWERPSVRWARGGSGGRSVAGAHPRCTRRTARSVCRQAELGGRDQ